jgi:hypothetical protein
MMAAASEKINHSSSFLMYDTNGHIVSQRDSNGEIIPFHDRAPDARIETAGAARRPEVVKPATPIYFEQTAIDSLANVAKSQN